MSTGVTGDNKRSGGAPSSKVVKSFPIRETPKPPIKLSSTESGVPRRLKLRKKPRETSHGFAMKHSVHPRSKKETARIKHISEAYKKKREDPETQQTKVSKQEATRQAESPSAASSESIETPAVTEATEEESKEPYRSADQKTDETAEDGLPEGAAEKSEQRSEKEVSMEEVRSWMSAIWSQSTRNLKWPSVSVGFIQFEKSTILAYTTQENIPREFVNTKAAVRLGKGYHTIDVDLYADAHKRREAAIKWTKMSSAAPLHLRFVTPGAQRPFDRLFPQDITEDRLASASKETQEDTSTEEDKIGASSSPPLSSIAAGTAQQLPATAGVDGLYDVRHSPAKPTPPPSKSIRQVVPQDGTRTEGRPMGGSIHVTVKGKDLFIEDTTPNLFVTIVGKKLHVPLLERLLEIPIDVQEGRVDGVVTITSNTPRTWQMPRIDGQVQLQDVDMHFWDAPDHISKANFNLVLENNRMYFQNAAGYFGALPLVISGDMDVDPEFGEYRLTAVVSPVEFNVARATFGIRPMPNPIAGAFQGLVHCTGPLRQPVFSGVINCIQPTEEMFQSMEESNAKTALNSLPGAVGAFDKIPFSSGRVLFTHDMGTDVFTVHDFSAQPAGGGKLRGSGQLWVAPCAERDPQALHLRCEGYGVAAHDLVQRYVPDDMELPKVLDCGATNVRMSMQGSHAAPRTEIRWESPSVQVTGEASLSRTAWKATAKGPAFDISGTLHTKFPEFEATKHVYRQREMTELCQPVIRGVDSDMNLKGCDMLPFFSNTSTPSHMKSYQAVRLKVSGGAHIQARQISSKHGLEIDPQHFQGEVTLQGLRMNQLNLAKQMAGQLEVSPSGISLKAAGQRGDEMMEFNIQFPEQGDWPLQETTSDEDTNGEIQSKVLDKADQRPQHAMLKDAQFSLKQGRLEISSQVNSDTNRVMMRVHGLTLDELELASLRGELQDLSLDVNFLKKEGRGELHMTSPRYSGLKGKALSGGFRWERDVVRLEKMILEQNASQYEVQGEYALPTTVPQLVTTSAEGNPNWLPGEVLAATVEPYIGRWRLQVNIPRADVQEILPGMRLLREATTVREIDYEKAREEFLKGLREGGLTSPPLREFVQNERRRREAESRKEVPESETVPPAPLPGIQSLKGTWCGTLQAFGGGGGASTLNFNLRGDSWKWGDYEVDRAITVGSYHSAEGVHLEEISLRTGDAHFALRGDLLGPKQNATFMLNDFPAALLSPLYKAVPALQNAVPAVSDHTQRIKRLMDGWERTKTTLGLSDVKEDTPMEKITKGSPVNGLLFVRGTVGGSVESPEGLLELELYDGMIGTAPLAAASAQLELGPQRIVEFKLESTPSESKGHLRIEGTMPVHPNGGLGDANVRLRIHDGGMAIVAAMIPDFKWQTGHAMIDLTLKGDVTDPQIEGKARVSRATLSVPNLRHPLKHTTGTIRVEDGKLVVDQFEAKSGHHGHIKAKGTLPVLKDVTHKSKAQNEDELSVFVSKLELKVNSLYNGRLDSHLKFRRCLKEPVISGDIEISKGNLVLQFGALANAPPTEVSTAMTTTYRPGAMRFQDAQLPRSEPDVSITPPVISIPKQVPMDGIRLENLKFKLGSELRFQVPFMVNLLLSGGIEVSGPPKDLVPVGEIYIDGGMVNLFATQLSIAREDSPGKVRFVAEQGFDPDLDFTLTSPAEGFKAICKGRASSWQESVILRFSGVNAATDEENLSQAAKVFQSKLADALVAENGQLALLNLAASTMATMSPRFDTWGQIGGARWRIVSSPNIPYLLTNSERLDFHDILTSLLSGTEIEVQYGPTQAVIAHKTHGSTSGIQWNLALNLTDNLKLTAGVVNTPSTTTSVLFQYSSEARTRMK